MFCINLIARFGSLALSIFNVVSFVKNDTEILHGEQSAMTSPISIFGNHLVEFREHDPVTCNNDVGSGRCIRFTA